MTSLLSECSTLTSSERSRRARTASALSMFAVADNPRPPLGPHGTVSLPSGRACDVEPAMTAILTVIGGLGLVVALGWFLARFRVLDGDASLVLAKVVFNVATPAVLVATLSTADLHLMLSRTALVTVVTTATMTLVAGLLLRLVLRRSGSETVVGALAASYLNAGNIGLPLAIFLFDNPLVVVPTLLFQLLVLAPTSFAILESAGGTRDRAGILRGVGRSVRNPIVIGAVVGVAVGALPFDIPPVLSNPLTMIGATAAPLGLIVLGMSLARGHDAEDQAGPRQSRWPDVTIAVLLRSVVHPLAAWALGSAVGLDGIALYGVVGMAALPTAQNVFVYSMRYRTGQVVARNTQLITTALCVPVLVVAGLLLG